MIGSVKNQLETSEGLEKTAVRTAQIAAIILFFIFPILQVYSTRSAPLFLAIAALVVIGPEIYLWRAKTASEGVLDVIKRSPVLVSFWLLFFWISVSVFWSPMPEKSVFSSFAIACYALCTWLISRALARINRDSLFWLISISTVVVSGFLVSELSNVTRFHKIVGNQSLHDLNRNVVFLVIILWPLFLLAERQRPKIAMLSIAVISICIAVFLSASGSAKLALVVSAFLFLILQFLPRTASLVFVFLAATIILTPLAVKSLTFLTPTFQAQNWWSAAARFSIWEGHMKLLKERPVLGYGAFGDRDAGKKEKIPFTSIKKGGVVGTKFTTHAHSSLVQIWFNFGLIGAALTSAFMLAIGWRVRSFDHRDAAATAVTISAIFLAAVAGASVFQGWLLASIAIITSFLLASIKLTSRHA